MNFSEVKKIDIPQGDVLKIEKDGVVLWQKTGQWQTDQVYVQKNKMITAYDWTWAGVNWVVSKYNYGNYSELYGDNSIPPRGTAGTDGVMYAGVRSGVQSGKVNKFKYNAPWIGMQFNSLRIGVHYLYTDRNVTFYIYDGTHTTILGESTLNIRTGWVSVSLNQTGKNYFNTSNPQGVEFILDFKVNGSTDTTLPIFPYGGDSTDGAPVIYFQ